MMRLTERDVLTLRDLCEGVFVLGNPGSGKSSTTGTIVPMAALRGRWGVVAYCTKPDDCEFWLRLCRIAQVRGPVRVIRPDGRTRFNLMRYELERRTPGGGNTLKLATMLFELFKEGKPSLTPSENSEFFNSSGTSLLCHVLDALRLAAEPCSFRAIKRMLESTAKSSEELEFESWRDGYCRAVLAAANERASTHEDHELCEEFTSFFIRSLPEFNERTRGDIFATIDAALFQLTREPVRTLLDSPAGCDFVPDELEHGAVWIIDCPVSVYGAVGRLVTMTFKRIVKDYFARRPLRGDATRPILHFCDECQTYVSRHDAEFQQVCRSNRIVGMSLTQSIDNLVVALGSEPHANSLANALSTHVYHCTSGHTAEWVQRRIADAWRSMESVSISSDGAAQHRGPSVSLSEHLHPQVLASELTRLRTGGPLNGNLVDAICLKPGRRFHASGGPFVRVCFQQQG
ncbi:MAG: TraM recognition domain-containing protein [Phycisphaerales bacterium]|nr:TraM recognition domain-containing protein [Phycisphaerales bacterium]